MIGDAMAGTDPPADDSISYEEWFARAESQGMNALPGPLVIAGSFCFKALGNPEFESMPWKDIVTNVGDWDFAEVERELQGFGLSETVHYLDPTFAGIRLIDAGGRTDPHEVDPTVPIRAWGIYVKYLEELGEWRVHALGAPDFSDLPRFQ
jgi:hypothetical protein